MGVPGRKGIGVAVTHSWLRLELSLPDFSSAAGTFSRGSATT